MPVDLKELRARLNDIDRELLELIAARQQVSLEIGAVKRTQGLPTRDFGREKQVIDQAKREAARLDLPSATAESIMGILIRSSLVNQEQARVRAEGQGSGKPALVIGGAGKMGRWFVDFLQSQGFAVTVADPGGRPDGYPWVADWRETPDVYAITVVAAPLDGTADVLTGLAEGPRQGLIFDVASLKSPVEAALRGLIRRGARATSVHPMFGPDTDLLSGRHVLFLEAGCPEATAEARQLFSSTMAEQITMEISEHDRLIAYVLGLSHALNIAFFTALAESGETGARLADISSTTFDAQLDVASRVAQESPKLYFDIQRDNPHGIAVLEELQRAVSEVLGAVKGGDEAGFTRLMEQGRQYLARRR